MKKDKQTEELVPLLMEREKELNCLYYVDEILGNRSSSLTDIFQDLITAIPTGWRYPKDCQARIIYKDQTYESPRHKPARCQESAPIFVGDKEAGSVEVSYIKEVPETSEGPFLKQESQLLRTIADRIGQTLLHRQLESLLSEQKETTSEWKAVVDMLRRTDEKLYLYCSRKMLYHLFCRGITEARETLQSFGSEFAAQYAEVMGEVNIPTRKESRENLLQISEKVFRIASRYLNDEEILSSLHKWIQENRLGYLIRTVDSDIMSLKEIIDVLLRYHAQAGNETVLSESTDKWLRVSLIRRFFTDDVEFINYAKQYLKVSDFFDLVSRIIYPAGSNGRLGGKSTGLFLAWHIISGAAEKNDLLEGIKMPKTWYMTADCLTEFLHYNDLGDVSELKYENIEQIRFEYPNIIQLFKHGRFPSDIYKGLSHALDEFGHNPIIVRSSSLLEDRAGTAFSGKYKSLFLPNQGSKKERLHALTDAIAEIYASVYNPDAILYRTEHGLLDFHEEMGIMIQEVVGCRVGPYYMPNYAGVAFSSNEFRWSPRLKREDGLIRLVPGLGTRAVDRISNDYPAMISPGQPDIRVNATPDEVRYYSPSYVDAINLETCTLETISFQRLLADYGNELPNLSRIVSTYRDGEIRRLSPLETDLEKTELVATFDGLIKRTSFDRKMKQILQTLQEGMNTPVDIEFACDGEDFYLLQCRPQFTEEVEVPEAIRQDIPLKEILFRIHRFISNGWVPDITHIVYVPPAHYAQQKSLDTMVDIGRAVGKLNTLLPKRRFILMGPGRWGSRGDIKQGVPITYSDISHTAALVEIAYKKGAYEPELSFGTHFFQDMVEAGIRYIPIYPHEADSVFNEKFLLSSENILADILPEYEYLEDTLRVIDVSKQKDEKVLKILMNADINEGIGFFDKPAPISEQIKVPRKTTVIHNEEYWQWRLRMAEQLALRLGSRKFGVVAVYLIGSTASATAGPASDIDLLLHFKGTPSQRKALMTWLEGWSLCLSEQNYLRTGYSTDGLLDVHILTDEDINKGTSFATMIDAVTNPAMKLSMGQE